MGKIQSQSGLKTGSVASTWSAFKPPAGPPSHHLLGSVSITKGMPNIFLLDLWTTNKQ